MLPFPPSSQRLQRRRQPSSPRTPLLALLLLSLPLTLLLCCSTLAVSGQGQSPCVPSAPLHGSVGTCPDGGAAMAANTNCSYTCDDGWTFAPATGEVRCEYSGTWLFSEPQGCTVCAPDSYWRAAGQTCAACLSQGCQGTAECARGYAPSDLCADCAQGFHRQALSGSDDFQCVVGAEPEPSSSSSSSSGGGGDQPVVFSSSTGGNGAGGNSSTGGQVWANDPKWNIVVVALAVTFALCCLVGICAVVHARRAYEARLLAERHDSQYVPMMHQQHQPSGSVGWHDRSYLNPLA
jgi:hypothetical protein